MHLYQNLQAVDFMQYGQAERRSRVRVAIPGNVVFGHQLAASNIALLRDVNARGAFLYCKQKPDVGQNATLKFSLYGQGDVQVICEGVVTRVEKSTPTGVAIQFSRYELHKGCDTLLPLQ